MELAWNKLILWLLAIIVGVIVIFILIKFLFVNGNNPVASILGMGKDQLG
jgi:hypothetical protein